MAGPFGDLGGRDAGVQSGGYGRVPQVVGTGGEWRSDLGGSER